MNRAAQDPTPNDPRPKGRKFLALLIVGFLIGAISTGHLIGGVQFPELKTHLFSPPAYLATAVCLALTTSNVLLRWFRWHFLIRRFTPHLITRDSLIVYLATLPAIISPFFLAELGRVFLIRRRFRTPASYLVRIWFAERFLDFCVVAIALLIAIVAQNGTLSMGAFSLPVTPAIAVAAGLGLFLSILLVFRLVLRTQSSSRVALVAAGALSVTALAWSLPVLGLYSTLGLLGNPITMNEAVVTFSRGTLVGGLTGLPLGVYVTGSTMIAELITAGVSQTASVLSVLVYRSGTAWYAVLLGLTTLIVFRRRLLAMARGDTEAHFDEIASEYEGEIPAHVRERLLEKKIVLIRQTLASYGVSAGSKGLDLGCGQGWYLTEMRRHGFDVDGTDYSQGQLDRAHEHLLAHSMDPGVLVQADAQSLPFEDQSYDFVYSINAIHHILAEGAQQRAMDEIVRVLRPGGVFLLHEINTYNPVFRWYMGYLFPLLKKIDEGNEEWILPTELPETRGARWDEENIEYFTFLPDFVPQIVLRACAGIERFLEQSVLRRMSAHYQACLIKNRDTPRQDEST